MINAYVLTGTLKDERTVAQGEDLPVGLSKVRLVIEPMNEPSGTTYQEAVNAIRTRQRERGFVPPSAHEVDATLQAERNGWDG